MKFENAVLPKRLPKLAECQRLAHILGLRTDVLRVRQVLGNVGWKSVCGVAETSVPKGLGAGATLRYTIHLVEVVRSIPVLETARALSTPETLDLRKRFADYLDWMMTSKNGQEERDAKNNHGTFGQTQV